MDDVLRINLWSGPRNVSTALMYSFRSRPDTRVVDEPLYAHYLRVTGAPHPSAEEVQKAGSRDGESVIRNIVLGPCDRPVLFLKQMAHHLADLDTGFLERTANVLLVRDPEEMLPSLAKNLKSPSLRDTGLAVQVRLLDELGDPPVLDARALLTDPRTVLTALCSRLGLEFEEGMLRWEPGPKPEDGVWAPHWYENVHRTTGFLPYRRKEAPFPENLRPLLDECRPLYERLREGDPTMTVELPDPRNENILVHVGGRLVPRGEAKVSVFDSSVQGGDAVWEGLRVYDGRIFRLEEHLDRLFASARALAFAEVPSRNEVKSAIFEALSANGMRDGAHIRLTLTRGLKTTSGMSPTFNRYGPCLIVLPEWKPPVYDQSGISLITAATRRNSPQCLDSKIHHANLLNNILAKIEANVAGVDDALMLDFEGFVSETNATNVFIVKGEALLTPHADYCLPGITRGVVIEIANTNGIPFAERRISLSEVHSADEVFTTGTMGELAPVLEVDGREIGGPGPVTLRIQELFRALTEREGEPAFT